MLGRIGGYISIWAGSQVMARVKLNGKDLGILWKPPYRVDVTDALKAGATPGNKGGQSLDQPHDRRRATARGQRSQPRRHAEVAAWLEEGKPSPTGRLTFTTWRL